MFEGTRDSLIQKVIQDQPIVKRLGTVHDFSLNTNEHTCSLSIGLIGEPYPIRLSAQYSIQKTDDGAEFSIFELHCEKQWIEEILRILTETKGDVFKFPISGLAAKLVLTFL